VAIRIHNSVVGSQSTPASLVGGVTTIPWLAPLTIKNKQKSHHNAQVWYQTEDCCENITLRLNDLLVTMVRGYVSSFCASLPTV
jgi:hypothetical protein